VTLDSNTQNNALLAVLVENAAAFSDDYDSVGTLNDGTTDYAITDVDSITREITVTGSPGAGPYEFYPHRIAGSTTTARVQSWRGRSPVGANGAEGGTVSGYVRRDEFQGHAIETYFTDDARWHASTPFRGGASGTNRYVMNEANAPAGQRPRPADDGLGNGTPRTGTTTHSPDVPVHAYMAGGVFNAS
jgi:hypothetical protein